MTSAPLAAMVAALALAGPPSQPNLPCSRVFTQVQHRQYARAVYNHRQKVTRRAQKRVQRMRTCQSTPEAATNAKRLTRRLRKSYKRRRAMTPYYCPGHGWFATECYIVANESRFSCTAQNPSSSAYGYYQLLDSWWGYLGRKPTCREQHAIAARLWNGGKGKYVHWRLTA